MTSLHIVAFAGTDRVDSFNRALLDRALAHVGDEHTVDLVASEDHTFPLLSQNIEATSGIPPEVQTLFDRFTPADTVLIASPEYNGGYSPLYKNTIDWLTRIDMRFLGGKYLGLLTASPGPGGGIRAQAQMTQQLENMRLAVHPEGFTVPGAPDALSANELPGLKDWVDGFLQAAISNAASREEDGS